MSKNLDTRLFRELGKLRVSMSFSLTEFSIKISNIYAFIACQSSHLAASQYGFLMKSNLIIYFLCFYNLPAALAFWILIITRKS